MVRHRRQQERDRLRADIVGAAMAVFAHAGSHAQMRDIAERADVAIGTLYAHFPDKDALLTAVMDELMGRVWRDIEPIATGSGPVLERLEALTRYRCEKWADYAPYFMAFSETCSRMMAGTAGDDSRTAVMAGWLERFHGLVLALLKQGVASGEVRSDVPPAVMVRAWDGMLMHNLVRPGEPPEPRPARVAGPVAALVRQAFAASGAAKPLPARRGRAKTTGENRK